MTHRLLALHASKEAELKSSSTSHFIIHLSFKPNLYLSCLDLEGNDGPQADKTKADTRIRATTKVHGHQVKEKATTKLNMAANKHDNTKKRFEKVVGSVLNIQFPFNESASGKSVFRGN